MMDELLGHYLGLTPQDVRALQALDSATLLSAPAVQRVLAGINLAVLRASLPEAQTVLMQGLPDFYSWLRQDMGVIEVPDSPSHAIEWIEELLLEQRQIPDLIQAHRRLPRSVLVQATPPFLKLFDRLTFGRVEWQQAAALLCLVLVVSATSQGQGHPSEVKPKDRL